MNILEDLNIIITGDFCPTDEVEALCLNGNYDSIYNNVLPLLKNKDLSITNLESPLTSQVSPIIKAGKNLIANPKCIDALKFADFDVVALANNHILDQSASGLRDTINSCKKAGIETVGASCQKQDISKILYVNKKNTKIAI